MVGVTFNTPQYWLLGVPMLVWWDVSRVSCFLQHFLLLCLSPFIDVQRAFSTWTGCQDSFRRPHSMLESLWHFHGKSHNRANQLRPPASPPFRTFACFASKEGKQDKRKGGNDGGCNTRTSREVTHPSTILAHGRLTAEFWWDPV